MPYTWYPEIGKTEVVVVFRNNRTGEERRVKMNRDKYREFVESALP